MPIKHIEHDEQVAFFQRCSMQLYRGGTLRDFVYSVPNALPYGGKRAMLQMLRLRAAGLTPGVPDIECFIAVPPYSGLHIELKKPDGRESDVRPDQRTVMKRMSECGRKCVVAFGWEAAWKELCLYLGL